MIYITTYWAYTMSAFVINTLVKPDGLYTSEKDCDAFPIVFQETGYYLLH